MTIKAQKIRVRRDEVTAIENTLPLWEIPIMEAVHQSGHGSTLGEEVILDRAAPEVEDEYMRLEQRYGRMTNEDGSRGVPFVAAVYGTLATGRQNLARAIAEATVSDDAADLVGNAA